MVLSSTDSSDSDYNPGENQVPVGRDGIFRSTRSKIAIPFKYDQSSPVSGSLRSMFQWPDEEDDGTGYASSGTISSTQERVLSTCMADANEDLRRRMEVQEEATKAQQEALTDIQRMLAQLISGSITTGPRNAGGSTAGGTKADNTNAEGGRTENLNSGNGDEQNEEENFTYEINEPPPKEAAIAENDTIKAMQAQIASLAQQGEMKKAGMVRPYPAGWDATPYPPRFKPPTLHSYDGKTSPNQHIYYFRSQTGNVINNDAIMTRLFIGTLKGVAFDWFRSLPAGSVNS